MVPLSMVVRDELLEYVQPEFEDVRQASARIASEIAGPMPPTAGRCSYTPCERYLVDMGQTRA
jgi:hypothetical protein